MYVCSFFSTLIRWCVLSSLCNITGMDCYCREESMADLCKFLEVQCNDRELAMKVRCSRPEQWYVLFLRCWDSWNYKLIFRDKMLLHLEQAVAARQTPVGRFRRRWSAKGADAIEHTFLSFSLCLFLTFVWFSYVRPRSPKRQRPLALALATGARLVIWVVCGDCLRAFNFVKKNK